MTYKHSWNFKCIPEPNVPNTIVETQSSFSRKSGTKWLKNTLVFVKECLNGCEHKKEEPISWVSLIISKEFFHSFSPKALENT